MRFRAAAGAAVQLVVIAAIVAAAAAAVDPPSQGAASSTGAAAPRTASSSSSSNNSSSSSSRLVLVYSIQRHGARNVLPKSAVLTESDAAGGPTLLPAGQAATRAAGAAFRRRYIAQASCSAQEPSLCLSQPGRERYGVINAPGVGLHNWNTQHNSSGLDRTIMSASSFLASALDAPAVPVYSMPDSQDWAIRGYAKCPACQRRLAAWLRSDEFAAKEAATAALRAKIQGLAPQLNTSLAAWWDVFDSFNVWRSHGVGTAMPPLDNETFAQVVDVAMWLETSKMQPQLTRNALGGALLGDLLRRLADAEAATSSGSSEAPYYKLLTVSSHYNTQLGVLSALQAGAPAGRRTDYAWRRTIPALAAVLAFELHQGPDGAYAVRAVFQDGPSAAYSVLPLPCAGGAAAEALAGPGACSLAAFRALAGPQALNSSSDWCEACGNSKVAACQLGALQRQLAEGGGGGGWRQRRRGYVSPGMVAVWCLVSVAAAALLATGAAVIFARSRRCRQQHHSSSAKAAASSSEGAVAPGVSLHQDSAGRHHSATGVL